VIFAALPIEVRLRTGACGNAKEPDGQITQKSVQPFAQKYSALVVGQIISTDSRILSHSEGRYANVTKRGMGMQWTRRRARRAMPMRTAKTCGPDASALASSFAEATPQMTVSTSRSPGRARYKP
jgi:hypothetical protein